MTQVAACGGTAEALQTTSPRLVCGDAEIENEKSHGDGEDAVAECGEAFDALSGNTVVEGVHRKEFSGVGWK